MLIISDEVKQNLQSATDCLEIMVLLKRKWRQSIISISNLHHLKKIHFHSSILIDLPNTNLIYFSFNIKFISSIVRNMLGGDTHHWNIYIDIYFLIHRLYPVHQESVIAWRKLIHFSKQAGRQVFYKNPNKSHSLIWGKQHIFNRKWACCAQLYPCLDSIQNATNPPIS